VTRLPPRVIPCLLLDDGGLVKTTKFTAPVYLGDAVNIVNLFNQFEVDEICLLDIGAGATGRGPDIALLRELAEECWVPLTYGGGISSIETVRAVLEIGIEKVVLGTAAAEAPALVGESADRFGSQAVAVAVDVRRAADGAPFVWYRNASRPTGEPPEAYARRAEDLGAGELLVTAVDRDGTMSGYDLDLIGSVAASVRIPVIASGGAGSRADLVEPIRAGAAAVAAGSLFVYRGTSRAVLVNFPERSAIEAMFSWRSGAVAG
jgi:cyclase